VVCRCVMTNSYLPATTPNGVSRNASMLALCHAVLCWVSPPAAPTCVGKPYTTSTISQG